MYRENENYTNQNIYKSQTSFKIEFSLFKSFPGKFIDILK